MGVHTLTQQWQHEQTREPSCIHGLMSLHPWHPRLPMQVTLNWSTSTRTDHTHAHQDALPGVCQHSVLCTWTSTCLHVPRGAVHTQRAGHEPKNTYLFIHIVVLSILGSTDCTCTSSSYRKSLVKKLNPSYSSLCFSHLPFSSAHKLPIPRIRAGNAQCTLIQGTYLFREVSQWRLHTVAHNMLRLPFQWTWL